MIVSRIFAIPLPRLYSKIVIGKESMVEVNVLAPMDGTIALHHVDVGDMVTSGQSLLEVEAMKTFVRVSSPENGQVIWLADLGVMCGGDEVVAKLET